MGRPRKVKKPNPRGPLTPTPSRRSSISSPNDNSSSKQATKPNTSSIWLGDASEDVGVDFGEVAFNQVLECSMFDRLSGEMLPSPTQTESFNRTLDARNELSTASADNVSHLEGKTTVKEPRSRPTDISKSGQLSATQQKYPSNDIVSLVDQALSTNKRAFDIHSQLSGILFDLRQQSLGCLTLIQHEGITGLEKTYMCVATLCEAIHSLQNLVEQQGGLADYEHPYILEAQVAFLAVTTVLDLYENYYSRFAGPTSYHAGHHGQGSNGVDPAWGTDESNLDRERASDPSFDFSSSATSQYPLEGSVSQRLGQLVHLTVMDFHLGQLQRIFHPSCLPPTSEGFTWEKYETNRQRLQNLRGTLQADIEVVKRGT